MNQFDLGTLNPGESKPFSVEIPEDAIGGILELEWKCSGCGLKSILHKRLDPKKLDKELEIRFACARCTPLWMKVRNFMRGLIE